jgi:L-ascorbate metabolism protein UlaG (beta-lactamase superfamily)
MQLTQVRNATLILDYGGQRLLIDPLFADSLAYPSFAGRSKNPTVNLLMPVEQILDGVTGVVVTHLHTDHFDSVAQQAINKGVPLFCQPGNDDTIKAAGFTGVRVVTESSPVWNGITITRTGGHHGLGAVEMQMGVISGFVFQAAGEPTVYLIGDSVMCVEVKDAIRAYGPDVIISNSGGAMWPDPENEGKRVYILMEIRETLDLLALAPGARVVASHMEALDHCTVTRAALREAADGAGISEARLLIPADGETILFA